MDWRKLPGLSRSDFSKIPLETNVDFLIENNYSKCTIDENNSLLKKFDDGCRFRISRNYPEYGRSIRFFNKCTNEYLTNIADLTGELSIKDDSFYLSKEINDEIGLDINNITFGGPYFIKQNKVNSPGSWFLCVNTDKFYDYDIFDIRIVDSSYLVGNQERIKRAQWFFWPDYKVTGDSRSLRCIYFDFSLTDDEIRNARCSSVINRSKCREEYFNYCKEGNNIFTSTCKEWIFKNRDQIDNDNKIQSLMEEKCKKNKDRKECACINTYLKLRNKQLVANDVPIYPHCLYSNCRGRNDVFRLRYQTDESCPNVICIIESLKVLADSTLNIVQVCSKDVTDEENQNGKGGNIFIFLIIFVFIVVFILILTKKK